MKIVIDQDTCCGAGTCVMVAPEVFDQREEDAIVVLLDAAPPQGLHETVREAASMCPGRAIQLDEGLRRTA